MRPSLIVADLFVLTFLAFGGFFFEIFFCSVGKFAHLSLGRGQSDHEAKFDSC